MCVVPSVLSGLKSSILVNRQRDAKSWISKDCFIIRARHARVVVEFGVVDGCHTGDATLAQSGRGNQRVRGGARQAGNERRETQTNSARRWRNTHSASLRKPCAKRSMNVKRSTTSVAIGETFTPITMPLTPFTSARTRSRTWRQARQHGTAVCLSQQERAGASTTLAAAAISSGGVTTNSQSASSSGIASRLDRRRRRDRSAFRARRRGMTAPRWLARDNIRRRWWWVGGGGCGRTRCSRGPGRGTGPAARGSAAGGRASCSPCATTSSRTCIEMACPVRIECLNNHE